MPHIPRPRRAPLWPTASAAEPAAALSRVERACLCARRRLCGFRPICGENVQTQDTITRYKVVGTHQVLLSRLTRFAHALSTQPGRREAVGFRSLDLTILYRARRELERDRARLRRSMHILSDSVLQTHIRQPGRVPVPWTFGRLCGRIKGSMV